MAIHVVTGFPRSGTSMIMACGIAGRLEPVWSRNRDISIAAKSDDGKWQLQHGKSVYEMGPLQTQTLMLRPEEYEGRLVKVMAFGLGSLPPYEGGYRYAVMWRDPEEIRQSLEGALSRIEMPWLSKPGSYDKRMAFLLAGIRAMPDTLSVTEFRYREDFTDASADPHASMSRLADAGWDIDVDAAARSVVKAHTRIKREELVLC